MQKELLVLLSDEFFIEHLQVSGKFFAVGSGKIPVEVADAPEPSIPLLLLRALADGQDGGEGCGECFLKCRRRLEI